MKTQIFYGAGAYARANLSHWIEQGLNPVCFCDKDEKKWGTFINKTADNDQGVPVMSLVSAIQKYPDFELYITVSPENCGSVQKSLIEIGISASNIRFPGRIRWCDKLGTTFISGATYNGGNLERFFSCCCEQYMKICASSGEIEQDIEEYKRICNEKLEQLAANMPCTCDGCNLIRYDRPQNYHPEIDKIYLTTGFMGESNCNYRYIFGEYRNKMDIFTDESNKESVPEILRYIAGIYRGKKLKINYMCGEITVSPYRDEILKIWKNNNWGGTCLTNAVIYDQNLADILSSGKVYTIVSLDSGSKETFANIKGVDYFDNVVSNIRKYNNNRCDIRLKYVFVPYRNYDYKDIKGFMEVAADLGRIIYLSRDNSLRERPLDIREISAFRYFYYLAKQYNLPVLITKSSFSAANRRLIEKVKVEYYD